MFLFVRVHAHNRGKLDPRAIKCIFVRYSSTQKGYKCYHSPPRQFYVSSDVSFVEYESYSNHPYLQRDTSFMEDTNVEDLFLLDLTSSMPKPSQSQSSMSKSMSKHSQILDPTSPPLGKKQANFGLLKEESNHHLTCAGPRVRIDHFL